MYISKPKNNYRPDIDGLRAVAILGVLLFHIDERLLKGGFLGVDVFFVISGYLITGIIQREIENGTFSFVTFYERRIRRIMPAFLATVFVTSIASYFLLLPQEFLELAKSIAYAVLSISNFLFLESSLDYFAPDSSAIPLLHTWSLAVEEQFYMIFPIMLILLHKILAIKKWGLYVLILLTAASLGASCLRGTQDPMSTFFMLPYRAWEMLLGAILTLPSLQKTHPLWSRITGIGGVVLILASFLVLNEFSAVFPISQIAACLGASLVIYSGGDQKSPSARILAFKPLVFIGLISYSLYLWHWPVIVLWRSIFPVTPLAMFCQMAASMAIGYASWRFIERPFRSPLVTTRKTIFTGWVTASILLLSGSIFVRKSNSFKEFYSENVRYFQSFKARNTNFDTPHAIRYSAKEAPIYGAENQKPVFALWGDSHARALVPKLHELAKSRNRSFQFFGFGGQPPVIGVQLKEIGDNPERARFSDEVLRHLLESDSISTVILHARWSYYNRGKNEAKTNQLTALYGHNFTTEEELDIYYENQIKKTVSALISGGKKVILIYPVPEAGIDVPDYLTRLAMMQRPIIETIECSNFKDRNSFVIEVLDSLSKEDGVTRLMPHEFLLKNNRLTIMKNNCPLYNDDDHLNNHGLEEIAPLLAKVFDTHESSLPEVKGNSPR